MPFQAKTKKIGSHFTSRKINDFGGNEKKSILQKSVLKEKFF
jgi:hypothetical protein